LGAAVRAFLQGEIVSGSTWVMAQVGFADLLARSQLVLVGEGSYDAQSALGKVTGVVIESAAQRGVPVILIAGHVSGTVPAHVHTVTGNGRRLDENDLRDLARDACARLLRP
jgi:glycerate kinase